MGLTGTCVCIDQSMSLLRVSIYAIHATKFSFFGHILFLSLNGFGVTGFKRNQPGAEDEISFRAARIAAGMTGFSK
jgi:hypothetical protein